MTGLSFVSLERCRLGVVKIIVGDEPRTGDSAAGWGRLKLPGELQQEAIVRVSKRGAWRSSLQGLGRAGQREQDMGSWCDWLAQCRWGQWQPSWPLFFFLRKKKRGEKLLVWVSDFLCFFRWPLVFFFYETKLVLLFGDFRRVSTPGEEAVTATFLSCRHIVRFFMLWKVNCFKGRALLKKQN